MLATSAQTLRLSVSSGRFWHYQSLSRSFAAGFAGAQMVTAGISEALVATAVGLLVAIPGRGFNVFQESEGRDGEAESLKSFLVGKLAE